jgi:hypothetical protein
MTYIAPFCCDCPFLLRWCFLPGWFDFYMARE